jgi:hypothetical protein
VRPSILVRGGTLLIAAALALSLGAGPAGAAESPQPLGTKSTLVEDRSNARLATGADLAGTRAARSTSSRAAAAPAPANVTKIKAHSTALFDATENYIDVDITLSDPSEAVDEVTLNLSVDGKKSGPLDVWWDPDLEVTYVIVPGTVGLGKAKFTGSTIHYASEFETAPTSDSTDSNSFYVRRDAYWDTAEYAVSGKTKKFSVEGMRIFSPSLGDFKSLGSIKLQYKTGGKWKTKKTIRLDAQGNGSYKLAKSTKYYYRFISGMTSTFVGVKLTTPKI